jgi:DHA1 family bicyclomycin/chloramphenicol resistance-like MFS transporter
MNGRFRLASDSRVFVLLLGALTALPPLSIDASLPAFPATARAFTVAPGALGATLGAFMIAFALGQLIWGPLSDRYGRRPTILSGLALYACAGFACAFARDAPELIAARFAQGLTACASTVGARAMIRDIFTERRSAAQMQGYVAAAMSVAPIVAPLLGAAILRVADWRAVYAMLAAAGGLLAALAYIGLGESAPRDALPARNPFPGYARYLVTPRSVALSFVVFGSFAGQFAFISGSPFVLMDQFGLGIGWYATAFAGASAAFVVGTLSTARIGRGRAEMPERLLAIGTFAMPVVGAAVLGAYSFGRTGPVAFVLAMGAYAFAAGMVMPNLFAIGMERAGAFAGIAAAVLGASQMAGGAVGSTLVGATGLVPSRAVGAVVLGAGVLVAAAYAASLTPDARAAIGLRPYNRARRS